MSRHPVRSRHEVGCLVQCTVLCTVQVTVWTLFMDTVHEHFSQGFEKKKTEYKKFKNFLGGNLKYEIFILKLLERR